MARRSVDPRFRLACRPSWSICCQDASIEALRLGVDQPFFVMDADPCGVSCRSVSAAAALDLPHLLHAPVMWQCLKTPENARKSMRRKFLDF
jgi:hypothetical protein